MRSISRLLFAVALSLLGAVPADAGLIERLMGLEEPKIAVHAFTAMVAEFMRGRVTGLQVRTGLGLTAAEASDAQAIRDRMLAPVNPLTRVELHDILLLAEQAVPPYDTPAAVRARLGIP